MARSTDVTNIIQSMQLGRQATVDAEELFVHNRSQRQCTERIHACIIYTFGVLPFAYER